MQSKSPYLGRVEVDIFSTAVFIARHCGLIVKSLLHVQCSQLVLQQKYVLFTYVHRKSNKQNINLKH